MIGGVTDASAKQAAARRNERGLDRFPYGQEGSASDRVGIKASPGDTAFAELDLCGVIISLAQRSVYAVFDLKIRKLINHRTVSSKCFLTFSSTMVCHSFLSIYNHQPTLSDSCE